MKPLWEWQGPIGIGRTLAQKKDAYTAVLKRQENEGVGVGAARERILAVGELPSLVWTTTVCASLFSIVPWMRTVSSFAATSPKVGKAQSAITPATSAPLANFSPNSDGNGASVHGRHPRPARKSTAPATPPILPSPPFTAF
jgi:hypothetical protein